MKSRVIMFSLLFLTASAWGGAYEVLYNFANGPDGGFPLSGPIADESGNLYGTTSSGGAYGAGVVFKLDPSGNETAIYSFTGGADGGSPYAGVIRDEDGNLYGTTFLGGTYNVGVVFKLDQSGKETVLYTFNGGTDGGFPQAGLTRDEDGNLYGATMGGGNGSSSCPFGSSGCGVIFKLDSSGNETVLYTFSGGADGDSPDASLLRDEDGNLYGTTQFGGNLSGSNCVFYGCGVVFKLDQRGRESVLYGFTGGADGLAPYDTPVLDEGGNLYGTAGYGGNESNSCPSGATGCGVVFKLDRRGKETVLYTFSGGTDGWQPFGSLVRSGDGRVYGTVAFGGPNPSSCNQGLGCGVVFEVDQSGEETTVHAFNGTDGSTPAFGPLLRYHGALYGTTNGGGTSGAGVVFKVLP
ncbi:MAG TPA: choice-of-anchor tandem repeat GloVer-containing protein [Burkholderiaceae bacterium]|nr:choice-of-anchor tandem repeat GloVer-containing protein [Burkholderiaceae bacterium]